MSLPTPLLLGAVAAIACSVSPAHAFTIAFSNADFGTSPVFSNVQTFNYDIDLGEPLTSGLFADPTINTIEYNVSGSLATTPSGFSGFNFQLSHLVAPPPAGPTSILGSLFYALNGTPTPGQTLRFQVSATANLSDGLQVSELEDLGGGVVFRKLLHQYGSARRTSCRFPGWFRNIPQAG